MLRRLLSNSLQSLPKSRISPPAQFTRAFRPQFSPPIRYQSSLPATPSSPTGPRSNPDEPKLQLTFTCTADSCGHRSTHMFTKRSYTSGIVLLQCPHCKNRHLIADHLGWFKDDTKGGKLRTVEDILREKGESIKKGRLGEDGVIEYLPDP